MVSSESTKIKHQMKVELKHNKSKIKLNAKQYVLTAAISIVTKRFDHLVD